MTLELTETTYVSMVCFVAVKNHDFMATLLKDAPESPFTLHFRIRNYSPKSRNPFDAEDEKRFWTARARPGATEAVLRAELMAGAQQMFSAVPKEQRCYLECVDVSGGAEKFLAELSKREWAHIHMIPMPGGKQ